MAFEVPAWDEGALAVKFKPGAKPAIDVPKTKPKKLKQKKPKVKKSERKQKSKVKQQINSTYRLGKGPLAPPVESSDSEADDEMRAMHKIRSGRIEKQKPPVKAAKDQKKQLTLKPALLQAAVEAMETTSTPASAPSATAAPEGALANKLHAELMGGRFRYINEQLYTMNSKKAEDLFRSDSGAFDAYHAGYRQQVEKWPSNPLNRIIKLVKRLSKTAVIGDFGCGEGKLAQSVPNKVYSMDLVSRRADIVACNITKTPLEAQALDVAVYCLSLMGTNLNDYLLEANRVLKLHGNVYIAEIQSRFEDVREFIRFMTSCGFDLVKKDVAVNYFYFFHFRKMRHVGKDVKLKPFSLKPCLYRKR